MTIAAHRPGPPARNGIPVRDYANGGGYAYRARRPAWMHAAIARAEAEHGPPVPTCACGQFLVSHGGYARCPGCGTSACHGSTP